MPLIATSRTFVSLPSQLDDGVITVPKIVSDIAYAGLFLGWNGAGDPIAKAGGSGGMTLISEQSLNSATDYTFTGLTGKRYKLEAKGKLWR